MHVYISYIIKYEARLVSNETTCLSLHSGDMTSLSADGIRLPCTLPASTVTTSLGDITRLPHEIHQRLHPVASPSKSHSETDLE